MVKNNIITYSNVSIRNTSILGIFNIDIIVNVSITDNIKIGKQHARFTRKIDYPAV